MDYRAALRTSFFALLVGIFGVYVYWNVSPKFFANQHSPSEATLGTGDYDAKDIYGVYHGRDVYSMLLPEPKVDSRVLGENTASKRIEVDLTNQRLYAYEGNTMVYNFLISSGLYDWTPRGTFWVWIKLRYTKMEGGVGADYYYLPNVPYVMYFSNNQIAASRGFGIHGTYWHNDFGRPKSHGCVNLSIPDAEKLYFWTEPMAQVPIIIYGKYGG